MVFFLNPKWIQPRRKLRRRNKGRQKDSIKVKQKIENMKKE
jgi:hypothetical protein